MTRADPNRFPDENQLRSVGDRIESLCQEHASSLGAEITRIADAELARVTEELAAEGEARLDGLAAAIRKIREAAEPVGVLTELVEAAPLFCNRAALLLHREGRVVGFRAAGPGEHPDVDSMKDLSLECSAAPAIAHAVQSRDTVITQSPPDNLSAEVAQRFGYADEQEVRVHPVVLRNTVVAVLLVDGGPVRGAAIEAMTLAAEAWIEALGSRTVRKGEEHD